MKTLLILRHAKSSWDDPSLSDHDRPLNDRGLKIAPLMGQLIKREGLVPDAMFSSTAVRAMHTALLVADASGFKNEALSVNRFYPGTPADYIETLAASDNSAQSIMVIGHNPGLEELLCALTKEHEILPTAALAHLELPLEQWSELTPKTKAKLIKVYRPKEIFT